MAKLFHKIFLVLAIVALFAVSIRAEDKDCPTNQEWKTCGTDCPSRCGEEPSPICTLRCAIGCQCKEGYVLNSKDECVEPKDC